MNIKLLLTGIVLLTQVTFSQPELDIKPNRIEFEDLFNRYDYAYLINKGDQILTIDSLNYKENNYIIDFEDNQTLPFTINPDDSVKMNVTLSGYYYITISDTLDTIYVYNNGIESPELLRVKIDFFEDEYGEINGTVTDSLQPLESAVVYFFYNGIYLLGTDSTDVSGNYQITLPEGEYTIATEKEGYYVVFHDSTYDPYFAAIVSLDSSEVKTIDFNMMEISDTLLSVSGEVIDSTIGFPLDKGIIIVRKGTHVPTPLSQTDFIEDTINVFAGFIKPDGSYKVNVQSDNYYYIQAFTNNFLPGYYNDEGNASVFWQNSDSVLINTIITDKNINLVRDSSYGGGSASGFINFSVEGSQYDFEGITLLARSLDNGSLYSYNFGKEDGAFKITNIPFGTYEIVGQKIGLDNALSQSITIDPFNTQITNITITFIVTNVVKEKLDIPDKIELYPNYPNPFNPVTIIKFKLHETEFITLKVYNIIGQEVATLVNGTLETGSYEVSFNAENLNSGVYFYTLQVGSFTRTKKMILLK
jgi:hypothetical protein